MDNGLYVALLNPSISLILAAAFATLWLYQRRRRHIAVLALGYAAATAGFLLQYFTLPVGFYATKFASNALFVATTFCIAGAIVSRCGRPVPFLALGLLSVAGLAAYAWFQFVDQVLAWRLLSVNFALGGMILVAAAELGMTPRRTAIQQIMFAVCLLAGLNFFARTLVVLYVDSPSEVYEGFYRSSYWTTVMLTHAILSVTIALTLIASIALETMAELRNEAQTDRLSALLNRRGFEEQSAKMLADARQRGLPVSLVICDLDHFKAVNDSFGHAAGDLIIAAFADLLRKAVPAGHAVGRIGGEEFAILLPGANLPAARLLAEGARSAFGALAIDGLPKLRRFTASFGVAELGHAEDVVDLFARADAALYVAKREGRNCVRLARPSFTRPSQHIAGSRLHQRVGQSS